MFIFVCVCVCVCAQLKVLPRDLQLCSETASGVDAGGQHEWGELVQLDPQTVGVIVRLERETFQVIVCSQAGLESPVCGVHAMNHTGNMKCSFHITK